MTGAGMTQRSHPQALRAISDLIEGERHQSHGLGQTLEQASGIVNPVKVADPGGTASHDEVGCPVVSPHQAVKDRFPRAGIAHGGTNRGQQNPSFGKGPSVRAGRLASEWRAERRRTWSAPPRGTAQSRRSSRVPFQQVLVGTVGEVARWEEGHRAPTLKTNPALHLFRPDRPRGRATGTETSSQRAPHHALGCNKTSTGLFEVGGAIYARSLFHQVTRERRRPNLRHRQ